MVMKVPRVRPWRKHQRVEMALNSERGIRVIEEVCLKKVKMNVRDAREEFYTQFTPLDANSEPSYEVRIS